MLFVNSIWDGLWRVHDRKNAVKSTQEVLTLA